MNHPIGFSIARTAFPPNVAGRDTVDAVATMRAPGFGDATHLYVAAHDAVYSWDATDETDPDGYRVLGHSRSATLAGRWILNGSRISLAPRGGGLDDWARVMAACAAMAYRGEVHLRTGAWLCKSNQRTISGTTLTFAPGCTLACTLTPVQLAGSFAASPFWNDAGSNIAATTTFAGNAAVGDLTITVASAAALEVGDYVALRKGSAWVRTRRIVGIAGAVLTLDEPLVRPYVIGDAVTLVSPPCDVTIYGNGVEITGTGDTVVQLNMAQRCYLNGLRASGTGWDLYCFGYDTGSRDSTFERCSADGGNIVLSGFANDFAERCHMVDCNARRFAYSNVSHHSTDGCTVTRGAITEMVSGVADAAAWLISVVDASDTYGTRDLVATGVTISNCTGPGVRVQNGAKGIDLIGLHVSKCQSGLSIGDGSAPTSDVHLIGGRMHDNTVIDVITTALGSGNLSRGAALPLGKDEQGGATFTIG